MGLLPEPSDDAAQREEIAKLAQVEKLNAIQDASMIGKVARIFNLDPDEVYEKSADWVFMWLYVNKMESEYQERYQKIYQDINSKKE